MIIDNSSILKHLFEADTVETPDQEKVDAPKGFDEDPMGFILSKYEGLHNGLKELMSDDFKQYLTAIFIIAPKPTTFKIILHNGQVFYMTYMGKQCYECNIAGKRHYLDNIGTKERAMNAIARLLKCGNPLKSKGPDGAEQGTRDEEPIDDGEETPTETPPAEGGEELTESLILKALLTEANTSGSTDAERVLAILINIKNKVKNEKQMTAFLSNNKDEDSQFLVNYFNKNMKDAGNLVNIYFNALKNIPEANKARQLGSGSYKTTMKWQNYGGIKSATSKTDVYTDGPHYSVKNGATSVRILDASAPQIVALINYTVDKLGYNEKIKKSLTNNINEISKLAKSDSFNLSRMYDNEKYGLGDLRKIEDEKLQTLIAEFDKNTVELNKVTNEIFKTAQSNPKFNTTFVYESITGKDMFGKESEGAADHILTFSNNFQTIKEYKMIDIAKKVSTSFKVPKFGTKSSGKRIAKTIQQFYKESPSKDSLQEIRNDFNKLVLLEDKLVNNKTLLEANIVKKSIEYIKNKFKQILDRISSFLNDLVDRLTTLVDESVSKALNLLGIETVIEESTVEYTADITYDQL